MYAAHARMCLTLYMRNMLVYLCVQLTRLDIRISDSSNSCKWSFIFCYLRFPLWPSFGKIHRAFYLCHHGAREWCLWDGLVSKGYGKGTGHRLVTVLSFHRKYYAFTILLFKWCCRRTVSSPCTIASLKRKHECDPERIVSCDVCIAHSCGVCIAHSCDVCIIHSPIYSCHHTQRNASLIVPPMHLWLYPPLAPNGMHLW